MLYAMSTSTPSKSSTNGQELRGEAIAKKEQDYAGHRTAKAVGKRERGDSHHPFVGCNINIGLCRSMVVFHPGCEQLMCTAHAQAPTCCRRGNGSAPAHFSPLTGLHPSSDLEQPCTCDSQAVSFPGTWE